MAKALTRPKQRPAQPEIPRTKFTKPAVVPAPAPSAAISPRPRGRLDDAEIDTICRVAKETWSATDPSSRTRSRNRGLRHLLAALNEYPGTTWQERFEAAGLNRRGYPVRELAATQGPRSEMTQGLEALLGLRIIQPTLEAFRSNYFRDYPSSFRIAQQDPGLEKFFNAVEERDVKRHWARRAVFDVTGALTVHGISFTDLTPEVFLHYARSMREARMAAYTYTTYIGHLAWEIMHEMGHFPASVPSTLRSALRTPQRTCRELIDRHQLRQQDVAELLVQYLERRSHDVDYATLRGLAHTLAFLF